MSINDLKPFFDLFRRIGQFLNLIQVPTLRQIPVCLSI